MLLGASGRKTMTKVDLSYLDDLKDYMQEVEDGLGALDRTPYGDVDKALDVLSSRASMARRLCDTMIRERDNG